MSITYVACFIGEDGRHFHWRDYRTFGGARRFIDDRWGTMFQTAHKLACWYILRQTVDFGEPIGRRVRGIVIAQQKTADARNPYKTRG